MNKGHDVAPGERQFQFLREVVGRLSSQHKGTVNLIFLSGVNSKRLVVAAWIAGLSKTLRLCPGLVTRLLQPICDMFHGQQGVVAGPWTCQDLPPRERAMARGQLKKNRASNEGHITLTMARAPFHRLPPKKTWMYYGTVPLKPT